MGHGKRISGTDASAASALSRRQVLKGMAGVVGSLSLAPVITACGDSGEQDPAAAEAIGGQLQIFGWSGYDHPDASRPFLERHDVRERLTPASGVPTEWFTKLKAGAGRTYSLMTPNFAFVEPLARAGLLEPIDFSKLPNTRAYFPFIDQLTKDYTVDGAAYFAPYLWGDGPLLYHEKFIPAAPSSWHDVFKPEYEGKVALADDATNNFWLWGRVLGYDDPAKITRSQLDELTELLSDLKRTSVRTITGNWNDIADAMAAGDIWIVASAGWAIVTGLAAEKGARVGFTIPKEGTYRWTDTWVIPKGAPNIDTAYAFADHMLAPRPQALTAVELTSATVNKKALPLLKPSERTLYPYTDASALSRLTPQTIAPALPDGDIMTLDDWTQAWDQVKAA